MQRISGQRWPGLLGGLGWLAVLGEFAGGRCAAQSVPANVVRTGATELLFSQPANMTVLNSRSAEDASSIAPGGLTIFFDSSRPGGLGNWDIWTATRETPDSPWTTPANAGTPVNSSYYEADPRISPDGLELYFTSDRPGGRGGGDIWVARRSDASGPFGTPENIGPAVNGGQDDFGAALSSDGLTLIFCVTDRPGGYGGGDLWVSTRKSRIEPWEPARNLGPAINTANNELFPCLSPDGRLLFFASNRTSGSNGNVWVASRPAPGAPFSPPARVALLATTAQRARPHHISADGKLYFGSHDRAGGQGDWDLWEAAFQTIPSLVNVAQTGRNEVKFEIKGRAGVSYTIETSDDLVTWEPWITTNVADTAELSTRAEGARRFYRSIGR